MLQVQGRRAYFSEAEFKPSNDSFILICFHLFSLTINSIFLPESWPDDFAECLIKKNLIDIRPYLIVSCKFSTKEERRPLGPSPKFPKLTPTAPPPPPFPVFLDLPNQGKFYVGLLKKWLHKNLLWQQPCTVHVHSFGHSLSNSDDL